MSHEARPWLFLGVTLAVTWLLELTAALTGESGADWWATALHYASGAVPLVVAVILLFRVHEPVFRRDFWLRLVDFRRIGRWWWLVIVGYYPVKTVLAAAVDAAAGGRWIEPEAAGQIVEQPALVVPLLLFWFVFGPVPEEPGWRGYALDGLQAGHSALVASAVLGVAWAVWHLPLFLIDGTWQAEEVGLGTQRFWPYILSIVVEAVLYTWIYNNTGRSTLAAIAFHFVGNAFGEMFAISSRAEVLAFVIACLTVAAVVAVWGPATLARSSFGFRAPRVGGDAATSGGQGRRR